MNPGSSSVRRQMRQSSSSNSKRYIPNAPGLHAVTPLTIRSVSVKEIRQILVALLSAGLLQESQIPLSVITTSAGTVQLAAINQVLAPGTLLYGDEVPDEVRLQPFGGEVIQGCLNPLNPRPLMNYEEGGWNFCFNTVDLDLIRKYQLNPYTGQQMDTEFVQRLGLEVQELDLDLCGETGVTYSAETVQWLNYYFDGTYLQAYQEPYRIPPAVRLEFKGCKPCEAVVVYRGMGSTDVGTAGEEYLLTSYSLSSWSYSEYIAKGFSTNGGLVLKLVLVDRDLLDIMVDTTMIDRRLNPGVTELRQQEVILLPGIYRTEVVRVGK